GAVLAHRIEHHRARGLGDHLAHDVDALGLQPLKVAKRGGRGRGRGSGRCTCDRGAGAALQTVVRRGASAAHGSPSPERLTWNQGALALAEISQQQLRKFTDEIWRDEIVPTLVEYIRIPNKSPSFEPDWASLGHMDKAVDLFVAWARPRLSALGASISVERLPGRTPLIFIDVPGAGGEDAVLLYGHLDKQPEMTGWAE